MGGGGGGGGGWRESKRDGAQRTDANAVLGLFWNAAVFILEDAFGSVILSDVEDPSEASKHESRQKYHRGNALLVASR